MYTRKMVPITGERAHSLNFFFYVCTLIERKRRRGRQNNNYRAINLLKAGFDTGFFARGGNHIFEEILDIFGQQNRKIQL